MSKLDITIFAAVFLVGGCVFALFHLTRYRWKYEDPARRKAAIARDKHLAKATTNGPLWAACFLGLFFADRLSFGRSGFGMLIVCIAGVGIFVANRTRQRRIKNFRRDLANKEYRTCPNCFYSLEGSPDEGRCPECGQHYSPGSLINDWSETIRNQSDG